MDIVGIKRFLNKNNDKTLDELIAELSQIVQGGAVFYDTPGEYTLQLPYYVTEIQLVAAAAGAGGNCGAQNSDPGRYETLWGAGGGGQCVNKKISIEDDSQRTVKIKIGKGGIGGKDFSDNKATNGESTVVYPFITLVGGFAASSNTGGAPGGEGGGRGGNGFNRYTLPQSGSPGMFGSGGSNGGQFGGAGGGGSYGKGGDGPKQHEDTTDKANGIHGGGGATGANSRKTNSNFYKGGNGGNGVVIIRWGGAME